MNNKSIDVVGIGNAIVDVLAHMDENFLVRENLIKGSMALIDASRAEALYNSMSEVIAISGGSAANTIAGLSELGGKGGFIGRVRDDELGRTFIEDLKSLSVEYTNIPASNGPPTGRCLIIVTPDAERTLNTYLGAGADLEPNDIDEDLIRSARITYLEGYLWDRPNAKQAFNKASEVAHNSNGKIAFSLSDSFCVDRWRQEFHSLIEQDIDILFANEDEIKSLYQVNEFDNAVNLIKNSCEIVVLTRAEKGSVIISGTDIFEISAEQVPRVVDTTGAGDLFAAGFLYGLSRSLDLHACGRLGGVVAAEIISHIGARPETSLSELVVEKLGNTS